ncbi:MAG: hypothetical protein Q8Q39_05030 [bacterium]|nr:hypothetical protein [bacterium]
MHDWAFTNEARIAAEKLSEPERIRARRFGKKILLGKEQRRDWLAPIAVYLFWCRNCERWAKDYPHGYSHRQYLNCSYCGFYHPFVPWRVQWRMAWEYARFCWRLGAARK